MFQRKQTAADRPSPLSPSGIPSPSGLRMNRSRSGFFLAGMRFLVALVLVLWLWIAPPHAMLGGSSAAVLFAGYLVFALVLLAVAWRSWWYEFQLARPAFVIDMATLLAGLFLTEAVTLDFFSPFITFFAFLMLSSAVRWSRRSMLLIAAALILGFLMAGWLIDWDGLPIDMARFARRFSTLVLLSLMLVWFAHGRQMAQAIRYDRPPGAQGLSPFEGVLHYAMGAYGADWGMMAWLDEGESRPRLHAIGIELPDAPGAVLLAEGVQAFLFDARQKRKIILRGGRHLVGRGNAELTDLVALCRRDEGLSFPIISRSGRGQIVLGGIPGLNGDDLFRAPVISREIGTALDEEETEALAREVALSRLRAQIATDLHDSVVQTLAGAKFRLQALRNRFSMREDVAQDIDMICAGISGEQDHVRKIIEQLRRGQIQTGQRDLHQELLTACGHLARQWMVEVNVAQSRDPIVVPTALNFELQQILREAIANAVRHGKADAIIIEPVIAGHHLRLAMTDNGGGFDATLPPRSIARRVAWLGGDLTVTSAPGQTRLVVTLPLDC